MNAWTTPAAVCARARRWWDDGSLLVAYVGGADCPSLDIPVRGPSAREIGPELARVRQWQDALVAGSGQGRTYAVAWRDIGGRAIGRMQVPDRIVVSQFGQFWRLLGVAPQVAALDDVVATTREQRPDLVAWVGRRALAVIEVAHEWPRLLAALDWITQHAGAGRYLREVTAPGVDTKLIERHQRLLAEMLQAVGTVQVSGGGRTFAARWGFAEPTPLVHLRLDPTLAALPAGIDEVALPLSAIGSLAVAPERVLIVENQVSFLSAPVPVRGAVVWGHGFDALRLGRIPWLADAQVHYWGDLDTHGFAILHGLRTQVPSARSVLMDRETLLAHRDRWVAEPRPSRATLDTLTRDERLLYTELLDDTYGPAVRLEQERIDWAHVLSALTTATG